jgi:hypothetical protein
MLSSHPTARVVLYVAALIAQVVSFFVALTSPELAAAFVSTSTVLGAAAAGTALSNISAPKEQ